MLPFGGKKDEQERRRHQGEGQDQTQRPDRRRAPAEGPDGPQFQDQRGQHQTPDGIPGPPAHDSRQELAGREAAKQEHAAGPGHAGTRGGQQRGDHEGGGSDKTPEKLCVLADKGMDPPAHPCADRGRRARHHGIADAVLIDPGTEKAAGKNP